MPRALVFVIFSFFIILSSECRSYIVRLYLPRGVVPQLLLLQHRGPVDGDVTPHDPFLPFYGPVIPVLAYLRHLVRVMLAEDVIYSYVNSEHEKERVPVLARCREDCVTVV